MLCEAKMLELMRRGEVGFVREERLVFMVLWSS
jgi:hypothetical protein